MESEGSQVTHGTTLLWFAFLLGAVFVVNLHRKRAAEKYPDRAPRLDDSSEVRARIWAEVLAGVLLTGGVAVAGYWGCETYLSPPKFCQALVERPPWTLFSGLAAAPALLLLWRWRTVHRESEIRQKDESNALARAAADASQRATRDQHELAQAQQLSSRFADAARLLAHAEPDAQLGGIYALQQLATDSAAIYKPLVVRTLSAFVRRHAAYDHPLSPPPDEYDETGPTTEVQAAVAVLGQLGPAGAVFAELQKIDLSEVDLHDADLAGANLNGTTLYKARLSGAIMVGANLNGAWARQASFVHANLSGATLQNAELNESSLCGVNLSGAQLQLASLVSANLEGADLTRAALHGADLRHATLNAAVLRGAELREIGLAGKESPRRTCLDGTTFAYADLSGADLSGTTGEPLLKSAHYDASTQLPDWLDPGSAGMVFDDDS